MSSHQALKDSIVQLSINSEHLSTASEKVKALSSAIEVANEVVKILDPSASGLKHGEDALEEIISTNTFRNTKMEEWFSFHPIYPDERLALKFFESDICEMKFYWLNDNSTKARISAGVMLTPNWEDRDTTENDDYKVGIDFFLKKDAKSLLMVISRRGNLRVMEFSGRLTHTQEQILDKIAGALSLTSRKAFHNVLWESMALSEVNKQFYQGIAYQFTILYQHLVKSGKNHEDSKLFASRLLGRLLFIWFLRKKNVIHNEDKYFPNEINDSTEYYNSILKPLFFQTLNTPTYARKNGDLNTPYLNGGLFDAHDNDWPYEKISFPNSYFTDLYGHLDKYNFTTDESSPDYEQVAIDPEMLGRVFESLLAEQLTDTGEQVRKAKGTFYTPREIVSHMCKESLRQYLYTQLGDEKYYAGVDKLIDSPDYEWETAHSNAKRDLWPFENMTKFIPKVIGILDSLTILDPACGSGAFPMGMLQLLTKVYERLDSRFDSYETKLSIIQNTIFGVDIEPMAVEISRLRAWLAIIVDDEGQIDPLPNLDFKFVCADSLRPLEQKVGLLDNPKLHEQMAEVRTKFFNARKPESKDEWRKKYYKLTSSTNMFSSGRELQLASFDPFKNQHSATFFDPDYMFGISNFDIVIGNPPYVSTKGVSTENKRIYENVYGFSDDLYNMFTFRGLSLLSEGGSLSYITPKTFWTTQTKRNMRDLLLSNSLCYIFDTANPFESALVDTCITQVKKDTFGNYKTPFYFIDGAKDIKNPIKMGPVDQTIYNRTQNHVIFKPTDYNMSIWNSYGEKVQALYDKWWNIIKTSKDIEKNKSILDNYRKSLKPGDITLLGCITEGGQGLATANNGKYIAVRRSTKWADKIIASRPKKLAEAISKNKKIIDELDGKSPEAFLRSKTEPEIATFFDVIKEKYGRDIFGQGYIYRIIDDSDMANVDSLTQDEKENGIDTSKKYYVPYEKGDKDGNRWFLDTPFAIAWSRENVRYLKTNSGKKGAGMPVVRNPQFNFREGFCWSAINTVYLKCRKKGKSVNDVQGMSLYMVDDCLPVDYVICLINSDFISNYVNDFINNTSIFQINDARQLPIIIPNNEQLDTILSLVKNAIEIKIQESKKTLTKEEAKIKIQDVETAMNKVVNKLYGV